MINIALSFAIKDLAENAALHDLVEISGDVNLREVDVLVGNHKLAAYDFKTVNFIQAEGVLKKIRRLLLDAMLFEEDELGNNNDLLSLSCSSQGQRRMHLIMNNLNDDELDLFINLLHVHATVARHMIPSENLIIAFSNETLENDAEKITIPEPFAAYARFLLRGEKTEGITIIPPWYWVQSIRARRNI